MIQCLCGTKGTVERFWLEYTSIPETGTFTTIILEQVMKLDLSVAVQEAFTAVLVAPSHFFSPNG